jgi:hypothetical protein
MLDLSEFPVLDGHCHPFLPGKEVEPFEQYFRLTDHPLPKRDIANTLLYRQTMRDLSRILGVTGRSEELIEERHKRYRRDPAGYIKLLFEDAKIDSLLVDTGFPAVENVGYSVNMTDFSKLLPCSVREIVRIEIIVYKLVGGQVPFERAVDEFHGQIERGVKRGAVALKSIVAYRTGLGVKRIDEARAKRAYGEVASEVGKGRPVKEVLSVKSEGVKAVYDHFVHLGVEDSVRLGVPFQMHTGLGDAPMDLMISNPLLLNDLINDPIAKDAKLVLVHGGYPFIEEAGFLVRSYPNVFLDLSGTIPFISVGSREKLLNLMEMAPTTKIMYGSDGFNIPELYWIASLHAKRALTAALDELMRSSAIDVGDAEEIARQFLSENAKRIYKL